MKVRDALKALLECDLDDDIYYQEMGTYYNTKIEGFIIEDGVIIFND